LLAIARKRRAYEVTDSGGLEYTSILQLTKALNNACVLMLTLYLLVRLASCDSKWESLGRHLV